MVRLLSQSINKETSLRTFSFYVFVDAVLISIIGTFSYILFVGVLPPYQRGFYCDDQSIRLPYKPNTVSVKFLLFVGISVAWLYVEFCEWLVLVNENFKSSPATKNGKLKHFFVVTTAVNTEFMLGLIIEIALMHFGKSVFGVLRPHFIDVCKPNFTLIDCSSNGGYILEPHCTGGTDKDIKAARESFPSGHSSAAVYSFCFVLFYVLSRAKRLKKPCIRIVLYATTFLYFLWTVRVLVTRVTDNWHHPTDVLGGVILGAFVAAVLLLRKDSAMQKDYGA